jgi:hypothetical protein
MLAKPPIKAVITFCKSLVVVLGEDLTVKYIVSPVTNGICVPSESFISTVKLAESPRVKVILVPIILSMAYLLLIYLSRVLKRGT